MQVFQSLNIDGRWMRGEIWLSTIYPMLDKVKIYLFNCNKKHKRNPLSDIVKINLFNYILIHKKPIQKSTELALPWAASNAILSLVIQFRLESSARGP